MKGFFHGREAVGLCIALILCSFFLLVSKASWFIPVLVVGLTIFLCGVLGVVICIKYGAWYPLSIERKGVEQRSVKDSETGQIESYCKEQEQKEHNVKELKNDSVVVIEEVPETKIAGQGSTGEVAYKRTIVTLHV